MEAGLFQYASVCLLVGFAGFVDSIAGGGGLISLPAYLAFGLPPHAALATNKFSGVCGTFTAAVRYWRAGAVRPGVALFAAAGALLGSAAGARAALAVPAGVINTVMLVGVPAALLFFLFHDRIPYPRLRGAGRGTAANAAAFGVGAVVGAYDGFFGPGTGTFLPIAFSAFLGFSLLSAAATARVANLASNLGAVTVFLWNGRVVFPLAVFAAAAGIAGSMLGSGLALRRGARVIRPLMVAVMLLLLAEVVRRRFWP